jgi:hypothetical protein
MSELINKPEVPVEHFESIRDFFNCFTFATKEEKQEALRLAGSALLDDPAVYVVEENGAVRMLDETTQPIPYSRIRTIGYEEEGEVYLYLG